ncbi:MAG: hypothetical protein BWX83_01069 [Candidatus Cloacimonetes bacterium ADurb.Bin117]|nr:MAG: hypothetical protein BWX83_01069 [Candidatus Cloacimonetes bacterium ADurb.Bin117]
MVPDHQPPVVVGADKVLAATMIAVDGALMGAVRDDKLGDEVVIRVQHAEAVVIASHEHVAVPVLGYMQVRVAKQARRTGDGTAVTAEFRVPNMDSVAVQKFPGSACLVKDGNAVSPTFRAGVVHVVGAKPFAVVAVHSAAIDVVRVDGTVGNVECLPDAILIFAGAQGAFTDGCGA